MVSGGLITPASKGGEETVTPRNRRVPTQQFTQKTPFEVLDELAVGISTIMGIRGGVDNTTGTTTAAAASQQFDEAVSKFVCGGDNEMDASTMTSSSVAERDFTKWVRSSLLRQLGRRGRTDSSHPNKSRAHSSRQGSSGDASGRTRTAPPPPSPTPPRAQDDDDDDDDGVWVPILPSSTKSSSPSNRSRVVKATTTPQRDIRSSPPQNPATTRHVAEF